MVWRGGAVKSPILASKAFDAVDFVVGAEAGNIIEVDLIFLRGGRHRTGGIVCAEVYLSDSPDGVGITAETPQAFGTQTPAVDYGDNVPLITNKAAQIISTANGTARLAVWHLSAHTFYVVVALPSGALVVSPAIAHV